MLIVIILLLVISLVLSGFYSGAETGLYCANCRYVWRLAADRNEPAAVRLQRLLRDPAALVTTMLVGTNIANYLATVSMAMLISHLAWASGEQQTEITDDADPDADCICVWRDGSQKLVSPESRQPDAVMQSADSVVACTVYLDRTCACFAIFKPADVALMAR